jgi:ABC-2 type transport system ATP-binding protein
VTQATITVEGVSVRYRATHALRGVDLAFRPGVTGLLGPNGAGKTTLFAVLAGQIHPDSGRVVLDNGPLRTAEAWKAWKKALGVMPQRFTPPRRWTCSEVVEYSAWLRLVPGRLAKQLGSESLEIVGLADRATATVGSLSGGMTQRLGIACAIVHKPRVLLLDEPANGLDIEQRQLFREVIRQLPDGATTVISSHLAEDIAALSDHVVVLREGSVVFDGRVSRFCAMESDVRPSAADIEGSYLRLVGARSPESTGDGV